MPIQYPQNENAWKEQPFGDVMWRAFSEPKINKDRDFKTHNEQVFEALSLLWDPNTGSEMIHPSDDGGRSYRLCLSALRGDEPRADDAVPTGLERKHLEEVARRRLFREADNQKDELLYAAMFHDIGKSIIHERHPVVGWHVIADLYSVEKQRMIDKFRSQEADEQRGNARLQRLLMLVRDHDKFGVLSTGEASLPILLPVASYTESEPMETRRSLAMLFMLTLADIAASVGAKPQEIQEGPGLADEKVKLLCRDWLKFDQAIMRTEGQREQLAEEALRLSKTSSATIERIRRLIAEASRSDPELKATVDSNYLIESALEDAFGPNAQVFCEDFALIAKLDYGLGFFQQLMVDCKKMERQPEEIIELVIAILRRITAAYRGLTRQEQGSRAGHKGAFNAVGVGFQNLGHKAKRARIIQLLFRSRERALRWLVDEITGWQAV